MPDLKCPWCLEKFGTLEQRKEHINANDCGLIPARERLEARRVRTEGA